MIERRAHSGRGPARTDGAGASRWLLLPIEVKARGFEGRTLLGAHAAAQGWNVVVGHKGHINGAIDELPRGLYFDKCIQAMSLDRIRYLKAIGNTYAAIDEEGLVHEGGSQTYPRRRFTVQTLAETAAFCAWGPAQAEVVRATAPQLADRVVVTGNPRVDLWRPELHDLYRDRVDRIRRDVGRFVLFPSNFANVVGAGDPRLTEEFGRASGHYDNDQERTRFEDYLDLRRRILERLRLVLPRLARSLPDGTSVVIRPHPSEDHSFWREVAAAEPRVAVHYDGPLTPWLLASDAVVHSNCTSGVEAVVAGVPVVAYAPYDESAYTMLPNQVCSVVDNDDDLVATVVAQLHGDWKAPEAARATLEHHLASLTGPLASTRMVEAFDQLDVRTDRGDGRHGHRASDAVRAFPVRARSSLARRRRAGIRPVPQPGQVVTKQKFPATTLQEFSSLVERIGAVLPELQGLHTREIAPSVYAIDARRV